MLRSTPRALRALLLLAPLPLAPLTACAPEGCLSGEDGCIVPSPCEQLAFTCDDGTAEVRVLGAGDTLPTENDTLGAPGDFVLSNDKVSVTIEALDHPHYLGVTGGSILDLTTAGKANDALRHVFQVTGVLPGDAVAYTSVEMLEEGDIKAVQFLGALESYPDVRVATRYEVRPCEPGVRIRTEIVNGTPDALSWFLADGYYYGDRGDLPFTPGRGLGFEYVPFGLTDLLAGFVSVPYMVFHAPSSPASTYAAVACNQEDLSGIHSTILSAVGLTPRIVMPRDYLVFERFLAAVDDPSVAAGGDIALEIREQIFGEAYAELSGTVVAPGGTLGTGLRATVLISEGTADTPTAERIPWSHAIPAADGTWSARVPANRAYVVSSEAYGQAGPEVEVTVGTESTTAPSITLEAVAEVTIDATIDGATDHVLVFVVPSDDTTSETSTGEMFGHFGECAPLLGNPHGPSPACNRVLVNGPTTVGIPSGTYDFYAVAGPFSTLASAQGVVLAGGTAQSVALDIALLDVQPAGTLSGDFHVHGGASFDSAIPDADRVRAFLASRIEVLATTEHDTVWDYAAEMEALGATDRIHLIEGTEATGHVLFPFRSDYGFPLVVGHWNFWPVAFDPAGPYRGAVWDELAEPGALMTRQETEGSWDAEAGIVQLNHPVGGLQFGRNYGWISATGMTLEEPPQAEYDRTGQSLYLHTPDGADYSNDDYDVQEVMNGTSNEGLLQYRAFWHYLLQHGIVRAGTANSDSHSLTENVLGTPRTLVYTDSTVADFDLNEFDAALREGRSTGTNGPVLQAVVTGAGDSVGPSVTPFAPEMDARLELVVDAAPWVPVAEVRILVNGAVVKTITDELTHPASPFDATGINRLITSLSLADLLPPGEDAWVVIEAGAPLEPNEDLDCDGIPDTGDNNGDGVIDGADVDTNGDGLVDDADLAAPPIEEGGCFDASGPLTDPPEPERWTPAWYFSQVVPNGYPMAFTNPFFIDGDGDGAFTGPEE